MWNKNLKTLDSFLCDFVLDLGVFGLQVALMPKYPKKTGITQLSDDLGRIVRPNLMWNVMWNVELEAIDYFRHVPPHDLGYLGPFSPNLLDAWKP